MAGVSTVMTSVSVFLAVTVTVVAASKVAPVTVEPTVISLESDTMIDCGSWPLATTTKPSTTTTLSL